jgi:hypothetical protein
LLLCFSGVLPVAARGSGPKGNVAETFRNDQAEKAAFPPSGSWNIDWAIGDFDGDQRPDLARTEVAGSGPRDGRYRVQISLSGSGMASSFEVHLARPAGLNIEARDIDGDHDLDLVVTAGLLHQRVGLWINDGQGNFTEADSSLYPDQVWRGPPQVGSDPVPAADQSVILDGLSLGLPTLRSARADFPLQHSGLRRASTFTHQLLSLSGPLSIRPPPFFENFS